MIDLDKLSALEKAAKRGPWYAWLKPVHTPDKCITTVPAEQFLREYKEAEKFNAELSERIGHAAVSDEWKNRYLTYDEEVIGCSEWLHAENADFYISHYFFLFRTFLTCFFHSGTVSARHTSQEAPAALQCSNAKHSPISAMVTPKIP